MQVKLPFRRESFYGLCFDWYIVDKDGQIAQVTTGFGPLPITLFSNEETYNVVWNHFEKLSNSTIGQLTDLAIDHMDKFPSCNFSHCLDEARRGLFVYDEVNNGPVHCQWAAPQTPLTIERLPEDVRNYLLKFHLPDISFKTFLQFNVEGFFSCH